VTKLQFIRTTCDCVVAVHVQSCDLTDRAQLKQCDHGVESHVVGRSDRTATAASADRPRSGSKEF